MNEQLLSHQKAFLLMCVYLAKDGKLTKSQAKKKLSRKVRRDLGLPFSLDAKADKEEVEVALTHVEKLLAPRFLSVRRHGKGASYRLGEAGAGEELLGNLPQYPKVLFYRLTGQMLNDLFAAVRRAAAQQASPPSPVPTPVPQLRPLEKALDHPQPPLHAHENGKPIIPQDFASAIFEEFEKLRREQQDPMVPIYKVRQRIAARFGPEAAGHDVLNPEIRRLRHEQRVRMIPISDLCEATAEQLTESIAGVNETFFYLEGANE
jgi:hypothetical protein